MSDATWSPIVEFRQYTLHPGARDTLIELFDRAFIESQEKLGMKVIAQFRPLDDPTASFGFVATRTCRRPRSGARGLLRRACSGRSTGTSPTQR